jgi:hypothetical protein
MKIAEVIDLINDKVKGIEKWECEDAEDAAFDTGFVDGLLWALDLVVMIDPEDA